MRSNCYLFGMFPRHQWSPWEDTSNGVICRGPDSREVGTYIRQTRRCTRCGKVQIHVAKSY